MIGTRVIRWLFDVADEYGYDEAGEYVGRRRGGYDRFGDPSPEPPRRREAVAEPPPDPGPAVLELEPVYANGSTGALVRFELEPGVDTRVPVPTGAVAFRVRAGVHRAGIYAGDTLAVEVESEPPPAFLGFRR